MSAQITYRPAPNINAVFTYTGADQTYVVPAGITTMTVTMWGAGGGSSISPAGGGTQTGGAGACLTGTLLVTPGETLTIIVGGPGTNTSVSSARPYGGGGIQGRSGQVYSSSGGGRSAIRRSTTDVVTVGAGGGGRNGIGGAGGITTGGTGQNSSATGGTQTGGGIHTGGGLDGTLNLGGDAGQDNSAAGGSGYYGGGGGGQDNNGGGGSSLYSNLLTYTGYTSATGVAPNTSSPLYVTGVGNGGTYAGGGTGGPGLVVLSVYNFAAPQLTIRLNNQVISNANQSYMGTGTIQTFTVPNGVFWIRFFLWGAGGYCQNGQRTYYGGAAGSGAYVEGNIRTSPGITYYIIVGRAGGYSALASGGGSSGGVGASGGGFSGIFSASPAVDSVIAIAGGGGGSGFNGGGNGGGGGYPAGAAGSGGGGGTQTAVGGGAQGSGSQFLGAQSPGNCGGGGGGWWGGGIGGDSKGGGGGSSTYISSVFNPITVNGNSTHDPVSLYTLAANESSPYWLSPYGRSGYDGYVVIGFNANTGSAPIQITVGNVLSATGTAFIADNSTYTIPAKVTKLRIFVWGGGGSGSGYGQSGCGGSGACVEGDLVVGSLTSLTVYLNRGAGGGNFGNNGAGYGAVYTATTGYLMIAGAGGGSGSGYGGGGGYLQGFNGGSPSIAGEVSVQSTAALGSGGGGGSQTQGGDAAPSAQAGSYLQGGNSEGSAYPSGGGGGYYGGGGGNGNSYGVSTRSGNGPGGGGSSYINPSYIKNYKGYDGQSGSTSNVLPGGSSSPYYVAGYGVGGYHTGGGGALVVIVPYLS